MMNAKPWLSEPDDVAFSEHGLPCVIHRNPYAGNLCGYVGVDKTHPWHGKNYSDYVKQADLAVDFDTRKIDDRVSTIALFCLDGEKLEAGEVSLDVGVAVHGGLTYAADTCPPSSDSSDGLWWFGFDCSHGGDLMPSYSDPETSVGKILLESGCDLRTMGVYRDVPYVKAECKHLAMQLARVTLRKKVSETNDNAVTEDGRPT